MKCRYTYRFRFISMDSAPFVFIQQKDKHHKHVHLTGFQSFWETHKKTKQTSKKMQTISEQML